MFVRYHKVVMIPYLPIDTNPLDVPKFYQQIVDNLEVRSGHHEAWHSHKRDPSVCWMCDLVELSKLLIHEVERYISKSALDIETELLDQEINSEEDTVNSNSDDELINGSSVSYQHGIKDPDDSDKVD